MADFVEWEIKNFAKICHCENPGEVLQGRGAKLYPRGVGGESEHLEVRFPDSSVGELSFIGSDGSAVICTRRPDADWEGDGRIFTGPKFEEVVAGIRRNEPLHQDRLILRWKTPPKNISSQWHSTVETYDYSAFFQIKPEMFHLEEHGGYLKIPHYFFISRIGFFFEGETQYIQETGSITGSTLEDMKVKFQFESFVKQTIVAQTSIWMLNGDNIIQKFEDSCFLYEDKKHLLPYEIPLKEIQWLQTIMHCKIITAQSMEHFYYDTKFPISPDKGLMEKISRFCKIKSLGIAENAVTTLTEDLMCLYQDPYLADFEIRCRTVSFPTHRVILSARSPVLKAMLSTDMREAVSGQMDIEDLDPHTLGNFIGFLYSGTTGEDLRWEEAKNLYYAADKYQVPSLKQECTAVLCGSVSLESVCDILSLADKHLDEALRSAAHNFTLENFDEVLVSENWEKFMLTDPLLAAKTVTHITKKNYVQKRGLITKQQGENSAKRAKIQDL